MVAFLDKWQVPFYIGAIIAGFAISIPSLGVVVEPVLGALIFATFMCVPLRRVRIPGRFLGALLVLNFVLVPIVVWLITRPLAGQSELIVPVALVLLAPCIDYVIVFTALAKGAHQRLLAATPVLLIAQMLALPILTPLVSGGDIQLEWQPFARAFLLLIVLPLVLAAIAQRSVTASKLSDDLMTPIMILTLFVVSSAYSRGVVEHARELMAAMAVFAVFAAVMVVIGVVVSRVLRLSRADGTAAIFSGVTRNSLVILPIGLTLPAATIEPAIVIISQTMVELIVMVLMVQFLPLLMRRMSA